MKIRFGKYILFFGKQKEPEVNPKLMEMLKEISVDVAKSKGQKVRKWQLEHKDEINNRRRELYNQRKTQDVCVKCGHKRVGRPALHKDGRPFLLCLKCRMQGKTPKKRGRGRPKGSKNKRPVGRPKKAK